MSIQTRRPATPVPAAATAPPPSTPRPPARRSVPSVTVVIPSYNEADNVAPLVARLDAALAGVEAASGVRPQVLYVDDSTDDTPARVREAARGTSHLDLRVVHRDRPTGGLSGAVIHGLRASRSGVVVVMDGDCQHPPETVPSVLAALRDDVDVVVASRYVDGGASSGLDGRLRTLVSRSSTLVARTAFPARLRDCQDPMTGFFAVRTDRVDLDLLRPRGFKILLELLASQPLRVAQVPLVFAERHAGTSKAGWDNGVAYLRQLAELRLRGWWSSRVLRFAAVGAVGALLNLALMAACMAAGASYLPASLVGAAVTIIGNFALQEALVFADLRRAGWAALGGRALGWAAFNGLELGVRTPVLVLLVRLGHVPGLLGQAVLLMAAFAARFAFSQHLLYRRRREAPAAAAPPTLTNVLLEDMTMTSAVTTPSAHVTDQSTGSGTERAVDPGTGVLDLDALALEERTLSHRPWGRFEQFCLNETVTVKVIDVEPGARLSLQRHAHRAETWLVLDVPMDVHVDGVEWTAGVGELVTVPCGAVHRLGNSTARAGRILEVARGVFDEDDIERLADDYARSPAPATGGPGA